MQSRPRYASFFFFNDTATTEIYTLSYTTLFRSHQDAIHLVGLHAAIFENQDRILGVQFPRRSDRGLQQSQASAQNSADGLTGENGFTPQPQLPSAFRPAHRLKK